MEREVLGLLRRNAGVYVSGQTMSREIGVSRTIIWKAVESLRKQGFRIDSRPNRGYRLKAGPGRLVGLDIETGLGTGIVGKSVVSFDTLPSTIDEATTLARAGCAEGTVVVAESQTGGRGRLGRRWSSPAGCGIWTSVVLRPQISPREAPKITLLTAVSVARVLNERYRIAARIKWPNDVVVDGRKICGALTELVAEQDVAKYVIVSFGLNVNQTLAKFPAEVAPIATSMRIEAGRKLDRPEVFRHVLRELDEQYAHFRKHGADVILTQWRQLSCTLGRLVRVELREGCVEGIARELDEDASLIIEVEGGALRPVAYGDVTIVR